jgi:hypothetical protein
MRPPWPNTLNFGGGDGAVRAVAFSPCKSFLACGITEQWWCMYGTDMASKHG